MPMDEKKYPIFLNVIFFIIIIPEVVYLEVTAKIKVYYLAIVC